MVSLDVIGVFITIGLIGMRYPVHGMAAILIHELGRLVMAFFLDGRITEAVTAGAFSTIAVSNADMIGGILISLGGPVANFIICATAGSFTPERAGYLLNPAAKLSQPFAVVNFRLAVLSGLFNLSQF